MSAKVRQRRELLVCGYIKQIERKYKIENIPIEIYDMIHSYHALNDKWCKKHIDDKYVWIDQDLMRIKILKDDSVSVFGECVVKEGIFAWKLRIITIKYNGFMGAPPFIVMIKSDDEYLREYKMTTNWERVGCQFASGNQGLWTYLQNIKREHDEQHSYGSCWNSDGQIIEIILDLDGGTLSFTVDGIDCGVAFSNIPKGSYRLAFGNASAGGSEFELL